MIQSVDLLLLQLEIPLPAVIKAAQLAQHHGIKVVLNPAPAQLLPAELPSLIDILIPNETEAVRIVFESAIPMKMIGWDVSHLYATFNPQEAEKLRNIGTSLAEFCVDIQKVLNEFCVEEMNLDGFDLPDPLAMAVALDPAVATRTKPLFVAIETDSNLCRGQTVVDHLMVTKHEPYAEVVFEVSRERFLCILYDAVR